MLDILEIAGCTIGNVSMKGNIIPSITVLVVNLIKAAIPIILIIFGMLDLAKAVMSNDEKEMKGAQTKLMKRVIYAVLVFLVISIVQLLFSVLSKNDVPGADVSGCISCFVSNAENC